MSLIPKIRPGEEISIEKLNALIDKVNNIEASKKELEDIRNEIRTDVEKHNAILESIKATQSVVQQVAQMDSLETITDLLQKFLSDNYKPSAETTQRFGMTSYSDGAVEIYLEEDGEKTASFILNQGAVGPEGPQGLQGPQGIPGLRGEIGPRGFRGITGKQGEGASIKADYINFVEDLSLLPSDLQQYLRIQVKHIDSEGNETLKDTCYIPTQGYIYLPEIYNDTDSPEDTSYIRFKKVVNTSSTAAGILDKSWRVTGPQGIAGAQGPQGVPGTGLTVSNLIRLSDSHIFQRKAIAPDNPCDTLETLLNNKTEEEQTALITSLMEGVTTYNLFGLIPLDADSIEDAHKFTFVEKLDDGWKLLRGVTFHTSAETPINVYNSSIQEPKTENALSQSITIGGSTYYKLIAGASFMHVPNTDSEFKTYLYTVYERARLDTLTGSEDFSYYVLVKNTINAGIEIKNINADTVEANNITLPENAAEKGVFRGRKLVVADITPSKENASIGTQDNYFDQAFINNIYANKENASIGTQNNHFNQAFVDNIYANKIFIKYSSEWTFMDPGDYEYSYNVPGLTELTNSLVMFKIVYKTFYVAYTPILLVRPGTSADPCFYSIIFGGFNYGPYSTDEPVHAAFGWTDSSFRLHIWDDRFYDATLQDGVEIYYIKLS